MSTIPAVTMEDLELERAELLPARETLHGFNFNPQFALLSGNNVASGNNVQVNVASVGGSQNANATATGNNSGAIFTW
jgi:hypothetical protein